MKIMKTRKKFAGEQKLKEMEEKNKKEEKEDARLRQNVRSLGN